MEAPVCVCSAVTEKQNFWFRDGRQKLEGRQGVGRVEGLLQMEGAGVKVMCPCFWLRPGVCSR